MAGEYPSFIVGRHREYDRSVANHRAYLADILRERDEQRRTGARLTPIERYIQEKLLRSLSSEIEHKSATSASIRAQTAVSLHDPAVQLATDYLSRGAASADGDGTIGLAGMGLQRKARRRVGSSPRKRSCTGPRRRARRRTGVGTRKKSSAKRKSAR